MPSWFGKAMLSIVCQCEKAVRLMAIKIAISLTALSLIQIGMAEVWDRKGSAPIVGQDRQAHYLFIPHHCRITARWVGRGVVARLVWWAVVQ